MIKNFETYDDFAVLIENSKQNPQLLLKHSTRCPISRAAMAEFERFDSKHEIADLWHLSVLDNQDVSEVVSDSTGIVHESPQAIVFYRGEAIWDASHYDIEVEAMLKAVTDLCAK